MNQPQNDEVAVTELCVELTQLVGVLWRLRSDGSQNRQQRIGLAHRAGAPTWCSRNGE